MRRRIFALATAAAVVVGGAMTMVLRPAYAAATCTVDYEITREWSTASGPSSPSPTWALPSPTGGCGSGRPGTK